MLWRQHDHWHKILRQQKAWAAKYKSRIRAFILTQGGSCNDVDSEVDSHLMTLRCRLPEALGDSYRSKLKGWNVESVNFYCPWKTNLTEMIQFIGKKLTNLNNKLEKSLIKRKKFERRSDEA